MNIIYEYNLWILLKNINYEYLTTLSNYKSYHGYYTKDKGFETSDNFLSELKTIGLENEKDFLFSIEIKPNSPQVLNYLAYGWLERDMNLEKATNMLKEAYQANPESYFIADSLAWAFFKNNKLTKAANLMEKVIVMAPGEAISLDHLGDIYFAMNRKREASFFWKQALDLAEPEDEISDKLKKKLEVYNAG